MNKEYHYAEQLGSYLKSNEWTLIATRKIQIKYTHTFINRGEWIEWDMKTMTAAKIIKLSKNYLLNSGKHKQYIVVVVECFLLLFCWQGIPGLFISDI